MDFLQKTDSGEAHHIPKTTPALTEFAA
jgi:hypothetical protein